MQTCVTVCMSRAFFLLRTVDAECTPMQLKRKREEEERVKREAEEKARIAELERLAAENAIKLVEEEEKLKFKDNEIGVCLTTCLDAAFKNYISGWLAKTVVFFFAISSCTETRM